MEDTIGVKSAIGNEAVDVGMPGQEVAKCLNRGKTVLGMIVRKKPKCFSYVSGYMF